MALTKDVYDLGGASRKIGAAMNLLAIP